ncbi:MAG: bifunctional DNA primase/helicase [Phycisphaerales bacterium]
MELAAKFGLDSTSRGGGDCLVIPFTREGQVVRRKFRRFDVIEGAAKWSADKGGERIAFNEDCLRDDSLTDFPLIITEGEFDAIAAIQAGFPRTISVPDGAPPPGNRDKDDLEGGAKYEWLKDIRALLNKDRVSEIILATDGDENGAALMQDLSVLLGRYRCKVLTYPLAPAKADLGRPRLKDLNEVLQFYGAKGLVEMINRAQWLRVDGVYRMGELPPLPPSVIYEPRFRLFAENFKCRLGDFSVITGTPGFGKTSFANDLFCGIAYENNLTIAWASFEQEPQRDHRRNLRSWFSGRREIDLTPPEQAVADRWIDAQHLFMIPREDEDATLEWLLDKMELAVARYGARIIVIDPWNELEHDRRQGESETEYIGRAIRTLKRFAKAFKVHICVIAHPTKSVKDGDGNYKMPTLYDINGSANWYNKADLGVIVHRETPDDTIVKVQKSRYHEVIGVPGEVRMQFSKDERRYIETERVA